VPKWGTPLPRGISTIDTGRSTGSRDLAHRLPACLRTQWHVDAPTLAYRCGGSTGLTPVSRLSRRETRGRAPGIDCARTFAYGKRARARSWL